MKTRLVPWLPAAWYTVLVTAIVAPWWLQPGYVWLLDGGWGPHQPVAWSPPDPTSLWRLIMHILGWALSYTAAQKLMLSLILLGLGLSGYYLARRWLSPGWAIVAGTLYLCNPFVYERLAAGQWMVLAGFTLLPLAVAWAHDALTSHRHPSAWRLSLLMALFPLVGLHVAYMAVGALLAFGLVHAAIARPAWLWSPRLFGWLAVTTALAAAVNSFWLLHFQPTLAAFTPTDFQTFRTAADPQLGVWGSALGLYGFWRGEAFIQPKDFLGSLWWGISLIIMALAAAGTAWAIRARQTTLIGLSLAAVLALILAVGYASPVTRTITDLLMQSLPGYAGLRDTGKLIGVVALAYAVLAPLGARWFTSWLAGASHWPQRAAMLTLTGLGLLNVTGLWNGLSRQVPVADYPSGWYNVRQHLATQNPAPTTVVVPWRGYLHLSFADNAFVANPAPVFFPGTLLVSRSLDNPRADQSLRPHDHLMLGLLTGRLSPQAWAAELKRQGATHVVLLKTDDWPAYHQALQPLSVQFEDTSIVLYHL